MTSYQKGAVQDLFNDIQDVTVGTQKANRYLLADVYQMTLAAEGFFPKKPISMVSNMPVNLRQSVSNSCTLCVSESRMQMYVGQAKGTLSEYSKALKLWLENVGVSFESENKISLHDMKSNLKIK
jgi:hypothetical protein